jgi:hypothetical protein
MSYPRPVEDLTPTTPGATTRGGRLLPWGVAAGHYALTTLAVFTALALR